MKTTTPLRDAIIQLARDTDLCSPGEHLHYREIARRLLVYRPGLPLDADAEDEKPNERHAHPKNALRGLINRMNEMTRVTEEGEFFRLPWGLWRRCPGKRGTFTVGRCTRGDDDLFAEVPVDPEGIRIVRRAATRRPSHDGMPRDAAVRRTLRTKHRAQQGICAACGRAIGVVQHAQFSHVQPLAAGGEDTPSNGVAMHWYCNWVQGNRTMAEARVSLTRDGVMDEHDVREADAALAAGLAAR